ncbi:hypothetical protein [Shewanella gelidii]|uniref:Chemotaxis protein n=1 Tax=Shewanella gelidii TaxID=1642821 RepID=A0A917JKZ4_9GAMM|nr:hypothetical protein [Shewanella gelidii]MCL1096791.1 hypothetical protein [Shewanella gelidii]GGI70222.1 hypothetical protein GCM10009332_04280 [Shewanella gelidii]
MSSRSLSIFVVCLIFCIFGLAAFQSASTIDGAKNTLNRDYKESVERTEKLAGIISATIQITRAVNKANSNLLTAEQLGFIVSDAMTQADAKWSAYRLSNTTPEMSQIIQEIKLLNRDLNIELVSLRDFTKPRQGFIGRDLDAYDGPLYEKTEPLAAKLAMLIDLEQERIKNSIKQESINLEGFNIQIYGYCLLGAICGALLLWLVRLPRMHVSQAGTTSVKAESQSQHHRVSSGKMRFKILSARQSHLRNKLRPRQA